MVDFSKSVNPCALEAVQTMLDDLKLALADTPLALSNGNMRVEIECRGWVPMQMSVDKMRFAQFINAERDHERKRS